MQSLKQTVELTVISLVFCIFLLLYGLCTRSEHYVSARSDYGIYLFHTVQLFSFTLEGITLYTKKFKLQFNKIVFSAWLSQVSQ